MRLSLFGLLAVASLSATVQAESNRSRFRGPNADAATAADNHIATTPSAGDWQSRAERHRQRAQLPPPEGYGEGGQEDTFAEQSFALDFATRREAFLDHCLKRPSGGAWGQMILAERGLPVWEGSIYGNLLRIDRRPDCADFTMQSILRLLYQYSDSGAFSDELLDHAKRSVLDFKYWPDEPGIDSMCTWSENHHILFSSAGYLAGQRYPERTFTNSGWTGREQMRRHRPRVLRWLELRFRTGFSEWLSNVYYDEDLAALANLVDFCEDEEIAYRATMVLDLMLADLACNSFHGCFASTHGRSYERHKKSARHESTTTVSKLCFGLGQFRGASMSATCLALSPNYRMPRVLYEIANDQAAQAMVNRQRMGIRLDQAERWGLGFDNVEDGMVWLSLEAYSHAKTLPLFVKMLDDFSWWDNAFFEQFKKQHPMIRDAQRTGGLAALAKHYEKDLTRNMREEVNIYTYRTADYMLSTAQDYRAGYGGDQQAIWQATLGPDAVCFTTHPVVGAKGTPAYWTGSGTLPRAAQVENVVLVVYDVTEKPGLYLTETADFTHAWLPRDRFDQTIERDGWIFARRGDGYLALWASQPYSWQTRSGEDKDRELIIDGRKSVWICELGRRALDGEFDQFAKRISAAPVEVADLQVTYESPSQGRLEFGWTKPLVRNNARVQLRDYPRYDNPFVKAKFPADQVDIRHGDHWLILDWRALERTTDE
jgi:hypothetical protein